MLKRGDKVKVVLFSSVIIVTLAIFLFLVAYAILTKFATPLPTFFLGNIFWAVIFLLVASITVYALVKGLMRRKIRRARKRVIPKAPPKKTAKKPSKDKKHVKGKMSSGKKPSKTAKKPVKGKKPTKKKPAKPKKKKPVKRKTKEEKMVEIDQRMKSIKSYLKKQKKYRV